MFALDNKDWMCRIHEGAAGMVCPRRGPVAPQPAPRHAVPLVAQVQAVWGPDGRHILVTADFSLHVTVWSLVTQVRRACVRVVCECVLVFARILCSGFWCLLLRHECCCDMSACVGLLLRYCFACACVCVRVEHV